jgi:type II secretory pathway pseudopilin PulG
MKNSKAPSFTLSEMLVVIIITAIVVGIAFSVLRLVQRHVFGIEKNFQKTTELNLLEQRLYQDFNTHNSILYDNEKLYLYSAQDTVIYTFGSLYSLRNTDTIKAKLLVSKLFYEGNEVKTGYINAVTLSAENELPDYTIFVSTRLDAAHYMNKNGF